MPSRKPRSTEDLYALVAKHLPKTLPKTRDLTLTILKGHLLAEECIDTLIALSFPTPTHIFEARLGFLQRLRVIQSLHKDAEFHALAEALTLLNDIRNALAHQIEPTRQDTLIPQFIEAAFNSGYRNARPIGSELRRLPQAPVKYTRIQLNQSIAWVLGRLSFYIRRAAKTSNAA